MSEKIAWIPVTERLPEKETPVLVGWLHDSGEFEMVKTVHEIFEGNWVDSHYEDISEWIDPQ